jgi:hypothetical protein
MYLERRTLERIQLTFKYFSRLEKPNSIDSSLFDLNDQSLAMSKALLFVN